MTFCGVVKMFGEIQGHKEGDIFKDRSSFFLC